MSKITEVVYFHTKSKKLLFLDESKLPEGYLTCIVSHSRAKDIKVEVDTFSDPNNSNKEVKSHLLPNNFTDTVWDAVFRFLDTGLFNSTDPKIIDCLDFIGFQLPKLDYPTEFLFIKLEEDWLREHLYELPDLGMSRLVKLTNDNQADLFKYVGRKQVLEYLGNAISLGCKRDIYDLNPKDVGTAYSSFTWLEMFNRVKKNIIPKDWALAGGSIVSMIFGDIVNDYDFFPICNSSNNCEQVVLDQIRRCLKAVYDDNHHKHNDKSKFSRTKNSINITSKKQVILRIYRSLAEVLIGFDLDSCCIGYYKGEIYMTKRFLHSMKYRVNMLDLSRCSTTMEYRLVKYARRGFDIYIPGIDYSLMRLDLINILRSTMKKPLCKFNSKTEGITIWPCRHKREAIVLKGLDIILLYYAGLRMNIKVSDYDPSDENNYTEKHPCPDDFPYILQSGRYYLGIPISIIMCNNIDAIFEIPEKYYTNGKFLLPQKIEFKTQNPGEQICGSFHRVVINDPDNWYNGYFYNSDHTDIDEIIDNQ